jgi:hypothetical protein
MTAGGWRGSRPEDGDRQEVKIGYWTLGIICRQHLAGLSELERTRTRINFRGHGAVYLGNSVGGVNKGPRVKISTGNPKRLR